MPKRPAGIEKKNGRYYVRITYMYQQYTPGHGFDTMKEAVEWRDNKYDEFRHGSTIKPHNILVKEYIEYYIKNHLYPRTQYRDNALAINSYNNIKHRLLSVARIIGHIGLQKLSHADMNRLRNHLLINYSSSYARNTFSQVKKALRYAKLDKLIYVNPADEIESIEAKIKKPVTLNNDQIRLLLDKAPPREAALIALGRLGGCRIGEAVALRRRDVDFKKKTFVIKMQYTEYLYKTPKTESSIRIVPMPDELVTILKTWYLQCGSKWLFPGTMGRPLGGQGWQAHTLKALLQDLGLPVVRYHSFRHSYIQMLFDNGIHLRDVMQLAGQITPQVTIKYDDRSQDHLNALISSINVFGDLNREYIANTRGGK